MDVDLARTGGLGSPKTYTYTDAELQTLLASVLDERGPGNLPPPSADGNGGVISPALQFLPHLPSSGARMDQAPSVFVPMDVPGALPLNGNAMPLPLPLPPHHDGPYELTAHAILPSSFESGPASSAPAQQWQQPPSHVPVQHWQQQTARVPAQRQAPRAAANRSSSLPPASAKQPHSQVEKQRRDRINSLIEELRELVPPQGSGDQGSVAVDSRRPKHVVLTDAISLIKGLQVQVADMHLSPPTGDGPRAWDELLTDEVDRHRQQQQQQQQQQRQQHGFVEQQAGAQAERHQAAASSQPVVPGSRASSNQAHPELPHAPDDASEWGSGVVVEHEGGRIKLVKVTCPDRHGLLADVVRALRELPLEITTAAITTRRDHVVYDVFEVEVQDPSLSADKLKAAVEATLCIPAEKKRKQEQQVPPRSAPED